MTCKNIHLLPLMAIIATMQLHAQTPEEAFNTFHQAPYAVSFCDMNFTQEDIDLINRLDIAESYDHNQFGNFDQLEQRVTKLLTTIGNNDPEVVVRIAHIISDITNKVMVISGEETAWISLRAFIPSHDYDMPRWHMDGYYFTPQDKSTVMYKFAITLLGDGTMFYPVEADQRREVWRKTINRPYMRDYCKQEQIIHAHQGQGAFFVSCRTTQSALHSEPPITKPRLFLSIVPCNEKQIEELKKKVNPAFKNQRKLTF